jgi:hypothetical protein
MDGFIHVVRCFQNEAVPHPAGSVNPHRDLETMENELVLNDLIAVERKIERLVDERKKGAGRDKTIIERELTLFERFLQALTAEQPLRDLTISTEEERMLSGFGFLSLKPVLVVFNLAEGQTAPQIEIVHHQTQSVSIQGRLEMDIAQLPQEEAALFLEEYQILEPSLNRVIRLSYDLLGLQSFFTVGEDEVRAWTVRRGATALEAAGAIHSDLQKGFIRAEVIGEKELVALGSMQEAKTKGRLRLEGKEYVVQDGEIVHIRFNL